MSRRNLILIMACTVAVLGLAGPVRAQSYIGLYLDAGRTTWCATGTPVYEAELWIYGLVEVGDGMKGFGFDITWPPNIDPIHWSTNPDVIGVYCDPKLGCPPGRDGVFQHCQRGWTWLMKCTLVVSSSEPAVVLLVPHPVSGVIGFSACDESIQIPLVVSEGVYLNYGPSLPPCSGPVPAAVTTWGAVKALYD